MTTLTFYGGVNEIGSNKILLQDKDTKVFLDFGMSFGKRGKYFDEFMSPRTATGLRDFIETGLIPDLDRVYPVHTVFPEAYKKVTDKIIIIQENKSYKI